MMELYDSQIVIGTQETSKCNICGEEISQPLFAEISSGAIVHEYFACPRCLSKVGTVEHREKEVDDSDGEEDPNEDTGIESQANNTEETSKCPHYLGFLKKRQKNSAIPEGCLVCTKMIECM